MDIPTPKEDAISLLVLPRETKRKTLYSASLNLDVGLLTTVSIAQFLTALARSCKPNGRKFTAVNLGASAFTFKKASLIACRHI